MTGSESSAEWNSSEGIDLAKLGGIIRRNYVILLIILIVINLISYLYLRWTKPLYQSVSEIKLDINTDATEFGIGNFFEEKNISILSGEIELLKSRLFFRKVIDSLDLDVGYYTEGRFLVDEKYPNPPVQVSYTATSDKWVDVPIYVDFEDDSKYRISLNRNFEESQFITFGEWAEIPGLELKIDKSVTHFDKNIKDFYFIINSYESLDRYFAESLSVEFLNPKANTLQITFKDHNPIKARDLVNVINRIYISYTQEEKSLANNKKIEWIDQQLEVIGTELNSYEDFFEEFTLKNKTTDVDTELKVTLSTINDIDSARFNVKSRIDQLKTLENQLNAGVLPVPHRDFSADLRSMIDQHGDLLLQKEQMSLSYKETTFAMQEIEQRISLSKDRIETMVSSQLRDLEVEFSRLSNRRNLLERNFAGIPEKTTEFNKNQRFYHLYEEFYLSLMQSKAEFQIAVAGITPNFKILSPASMPTVPIFPKPIIVYGAGFIASMFLIFMFVGIRYLTDDKLETIEQVEKKLPYPILGVVPKSRVKPGINRLVVSNSPKSGVSESLRTIRTNLQFISPGKGSKVITVTSSVGGEGKTFISINLGAILSTSNKKIVIVDLDMRKPSVGESLGKSSQSEKGVSTILIRKDKLEDCLFPTENENLFYIPSGPIPPNPSELLLNGEFDDLIANLRKRFDFILLDTPPVGLVTDGVLAIKRSDLTLMIVRAGYTKKKDIQHTKRHLKFNEANISVILNNVSRHGSYGYQYGYYQEKS